MIRPYLSTDKEKLLALLRLNIPTYFHPDEEQEYATYLEQHLEDYFVAEVDGAMVGAGGINYVDGGKTARISWDVVHPDLQGKGIGSNLTDHRLALIRSKPEVELLVVRTSQLVYRFYQKFGFRLVKTEKDFWAPGFDLYQLEIKLK